MKTLPLSRRTLVGITLAAALAPFTSIGFAAEAVRTVTPDAEALARLESFAREVRAAEGAFTQRSVGRDGKAVGPDSSGTFAFSRPGRFAWVYEKPYRQTIMSDGKTLWLHDEDLMQVTVRRLEGALPSTPAAILFGGHDFSHDWKVSALALPPGEKGLYVRAVPADRSAFEHVDILFGDGRFPVRAVLTDAFLNETTIEFRNVEERGLPADRFSFKVPEGTDVLDENIFG